MIKHYLLTAFRNLKRNPVYSLINIGGLALGMTAFLFILQYIGIETSVNKFHAKKDRIFRVINMDQKSEFWSELEPGFGPRFKENFPEVEDYCRIDNGIGTGVVQNEKANLSFRESGINYTEGNFFELFSFPLLHGEASDLRLPNTVFISESMALKYFGDEPAIDQTLILNNQFGKTSYTVKGIFKDMRYNSDLRMDMTFSLETLKTEANINGNDWARLDNIDSQFAQTLLLLKPNVNFKELEKKLTSYRESVSREDDGVSFRLQPMENMHLASSFNEELPTYGNVKNVIVVGVIGLLILLIAWFNYVNLSIAGSMKRSVEIGVRKAIGATRNNLIGQFLTQTALINVSSFLVAIMLVSTGYSFFNQMIGEDLPFMAYLDMKVLLWATLAFLFGTLLSGIFAAGLMSRFKTVQTIKGAASSSKTGSILRRSLIVMQFSVSAALILATVVIYSQLQFMQNKDLGIRTDNMLIITGPSIYGDNFDSQRKAFLGELASQSSVEELALSGAVPGRYYNFRTNGFTHAGSKPDDKFKSYAFVCTEGDYFTTYQIPVKAGRTFSPAEVAVEWNDNSKVMINEAALNYMGFENAQEAILSGIQWDERHLDIIGITADYHHLGLQTEIDPIIYYPQQYGQFYSLKLANGDTKAQIAGLEELYRSYFPGNPFDYSFLNEDFAKSLETEKQYGFVFSSASALAILIACMGLFGLTMFTVESRLKEIGVRKVLGASIVSVVALLSKDFLKLVILGLLIGTPITLYFMNNWLNEFPYRIEINGWMIVLVAVILLFIALITVSFQTIKGAVMNPSQSLKSD